MEQSSVTVRGGHARTTVEATRRLRTAREHADPGIDASRRRVARKAASRPSVALYESVLRETSPEDRKRCFALSTSLDPLWPLAMWIYRNCLKAPTHAVIAGLYGMSKQRIEQIEKAGARRYARGILAMRGEL